MGSTSYILPHRIMFIIKTYRIRSHLTVGQWYTKYYTNKMGFMHKLLEVLEALWSEQIFEWGIMRQQLYCLTCGE